MNLSTWRDAALVATLAILINACQAGSSNNGSPTGVQTATQSAGASATAGLPTSSTLNSAPTTEPTPSSAATAPARPMSMPPPLRYLWIREPRAVDGLAQPPNASAMVIKGAYVEFHANVDAHAPLKPAFVSVSSAVVDDTVDLSLVADVADCHAHEVGTYRFTISPSGRALTVAALDDGCATRSSALSGDWIRAACPSNQWCLGDLDAGPHASINYTPFTRFADWQFHYGRFGYTVPEGWSNPEDGSTAYFLAQQDGPDGSGVWVFSNVRAHAQGADCPHELAPGVDGSAANIVSWIRSLPGLAITNLQSVTIGGLTGESFDVAVKPTWDQTCPWDPTNPTVPLFLSAEQDDFDWGINRDSRMRLYLLTLSPDQTLLIDIEAQDAATWTNLLTEAVPIVESFEFSR